MSDLMKNDKGYPIPAIASFFLPGLGQFLKGHFFKALMFWIAVPLVYFLVGWLPLVGWAAGGLAWLINVLDAAFVRTA